MKTSAKIKEPLLAVEDALGRILTALSPVGAETIALSRGDGRVLAQDITARRTQPPFDASAMDGYAVRRADVQNLPADLRVIGEAAAGSAFAGSLEAGTAARIFTGAPLPAGADTIIIQEDTRAGDGTVTVLEAPASGKFIRKAGLDFAEGDLVAGAGETLEPCRLSLIASADVPWIEVYRRPRVAILATGDELVRPGEPRGRDQIVSSNSIGIAAVVSRCGGEPVDLGIARDDRTSLKAAFEAANGADFLVTLGGVSVGDHDLVGSVLSELGMSLDFWRIAMRPGKPLMFGMLGALPVLGLPGNPVSSLVCSQIFMRPAIARLSGAATSGTEPKKVILGKDLPENDQRQDYLRSRLEQTAEGEVRALPLDRQDSSMLRLLADADCLVIRPPHAAPAKAGDMVSVLIV